jgi:hypothetical protein
MPGIVICVETAKQMIVTQLKPLSASDRRTASVVAQRKRSR